MSRIVIDSSCWLEFFADSEVGKEIALLTKDIKAVIVPTVVIFEVFKKLMAEKGDDAAIFTIAQFRQAEIVDLTQEIALQAAKNSKEYKLAMADSIIYTIARKYDAILHTQDKHFQDLFLVKYYSKNG